MFSYSAAENIISFAQHILFGKKIIIHLAAENNNLWYFLLFALQLNLLSQVHLCLE